MTIDQVQSPSIPWSQEAEQSVLGALLLDNRSAWRLADVGLKAEDFYHEAHRTIWVALYGQIVANKPADVLTCAEALGSKAEQCGGLKYLNDLAQSVPSATNIQRYAQIVVDKAQRRALLAVGDEVQALAREDGEPAALLDQAMSALMALQRHKASQQAVSLRESMVTRTSHWEDMGKGVATPGMRTRLPRLDRGLGGGLQRGRVVVLAARPSVGKTSLAVQIALNVAADEHKVLVLSQEMPRGDLTDRITANLARIPLDTLAAGISPESNDWGKVTEAIDRPTAANLDIDDQPGLSLMAIRAKAQMAKHRSGLDLLVLDYLQLCAPSNNKVSRHHQIEEISRGLKVLAKELDVCVLVLSQINRGVTKEEREPNLSDLKESGAIEEDADVVMMLHPKGKLEGGAELVACIVTKNRQGKKGRVALRFEGAFQHWGECEADVSASAPAPAPARSYDNGL
jgi:replicative DNA helicase